MYLFSIQLRDYLHFNSVRGRNSVMPSGYHPGIPQSDQAYTKWETDRDEVEVDFKRLHQSRQSSWFSGAKGTVLKVLLIIVIFLVGLIIGYIIKRSVSDSDSMRIKCPYYMEAYGRYSTDLSAQVMKRLSKDNIQDNLRKYTEKVHITGTQENNAVGLLIMNQLIDYGLTVTTSKYKVLLSYPNWELPNTVFLLSDNGSVVYQTGYSGPPHKDEPDLTTPYLAFAPNGTVTGELMYANYGEESDFSLLESCKNNIVIMRYGKIFRGDKVRNAYNCGAAGVILYSDPADVTYHMRSDKDVYPSTWYMPGWAAQRGTIYMGYGDPLTPGLPAKPGIYRIPISEADLPRIPAQPIGYDDAQNLMMYMKGPTQQEFHGAMHMNVTYRAGPGFDSPRENWKVKLEVNNELESERDVTNIMAVIKGHEEPDRYVIVGVHYDAWTTGAADPNIATAALTEMARSLIEMEKAGWRPRRTIMFMFWDGEEQGMTGSSEWVEDHWQQLKDRTVAYINMDGGIRGNYSLKVQATPEIKNLMVNVTKMYPPAVPAVNVSTLYDLWYQRSSTSSCNTDSSEPLPRVDDVGYGSDQAAFVFSLGIPVIWPQYIHDTCIVGKYPGYHTDIDNFFYQTEFIDPGFVAAETYTKMVTEIVLQLSGLGRLPYDVRGLSQKVSDSFNNLNTVLMQEPFMQKHLLDPLRWAIGNFSDQAARFQDSYQQVDLTDILATRRYNDKAMKVSQSFIHPEGLPGKPQQKNVLFSPSEHNGYSGSTFSGITDAIASYKRAADRKESITVHWQTVQRQISLAVLAVQRAGSFLDEEYFP